jgi:predicted DCC family thiol-disulfide oxidoreductase YuxK
VLSAGRVAESTCPPQQPTLIYDSECGFCRKWVGRARIMDRRHVVNMVSLREAGAAVMAGRPTEALRRAVHLVRPDGAVFAGAAATREFFRYVPGGWLVRAFGVVPGVMPVAEQVYRLVAKRWGPVSD